MTTNFGLGFQTHILHAVFISIALKSNTLESFSSPTQKKKALQNCNINHKHLYIEHYQKEVSPTQTITNFAYNCTLRRNDCN